MEGEESLERPYRWKALLLAVVCLIVLPLGACSHTPEEEEALPREDVVETIDLTTGRNVERMREIVEGRQDIVDLPSLSSNISDGRVEVYELGADGNVLAALEGGAQSSPNPADAGAVQVNENVLIYPIDDEPAPVVARVVPEFMELDPSAASSGYGVEADRDYVSIALPDERLMKIHFAYNSSRIRPDSMGVLDEIAIMAKDFADQGISIEGHASKRSGLTNPTQRHMGNLKISMNRAYHVAQALAQRGVPSDKIRVIGWGEMMADRLGGGEDARRVEVLLLTR